MTTFQPNHIISISNKVLFPVILLLGLIPFQLEGKDQLIDSLKQVLATTQEDSIRYDLCREIGDAYYEGNFDSLLVYYNQSLELAKKTKYFRGEISTLRSFAYVYKYRKNDYDLAEQYFSKALKRTQEEKDTIAETYLLHDFGELYRSKGDYLTAIDYFFNSNQLAEAKNHTHLLTRTWYSLGLLHSEKKNHEEALDFYQKALVLTNDSTYARMKGRLLNNMGKTYFDLGQQEKSTHSFQAALTLFQQLDDNDLQADVFFNMAQTDHQLKQYEAAINNYKKAFSLNQIIDNKNRAAKILSELATTYLTIGKYDLAITTAQKGLIYVKEVDTQLHYGELNEVLAKSYTYLKQYQKAILHQQNAISARERLQQEATDKKLFRITTLYEKEKKNVEIAQLKEKNTAQLLTVNEVKFKLRLMGLLVLLFLALSVLLWNYNKRKQLEQNKQLRLKLTNDLHDNISSSLNHLKIIANKISSDDPYTGEQKKRYTKKIKEISKEVVHNMHDLIWGLDDKKLSLHDLILKMMDHANQVLNMSQIPYEVDNEVGESNQVLKPEIKNNIYAIFKESINNIVKHTKAKSVHISFYYEKGLFKMHIKNDTSVLVPVDHSSNIGLSSIKTRAESILGHLDISQTEQYFLISLQVDI